MARSNPGGPKSESEILFAAFELLRQLESAQSAVPRNDKLAGRLINKWRSTLNLTPKGVSTICEASLASYYRWANGNKMPRLKTEKLRGYLQKRLHEVEARNSFLYCDHRITVRTLDDLINRQICCTKVWSLKNMLPYRAAKPGIVQNKLFKYLTDTEREVQFNCIFCGNKNYSAINHVDHPAQATFAEFKKRFHDKYPTKSKRLKGWLISEQSTAYELGLTNNLVGVHVLEYSASRTPSDAPWSGRMVDILYEVPLALYQLHDPHKLQGGEESVWLELGPESSKLDWNERKQKFYDLEQGHYDDKGAAPFLATKSEIERFVL